MGIFDFLRTKKVNKASIITRYDPPSFDTNDFALNLNELSDRDQLVLLLISKTSLSHPHTIMMRLDRCDFPGKPEKNLTNLVANKLLYVSAANGFGHAVNYAVTEFGEDFVKNKIEPAKIIAHVKQMSDPDFMLKLVQNIFDRMENSSE